MKLKGCDKLFYELIISNMPMLDIIEQVCHCMQNTYVDPSSVHEGLNQSIHEEELAETFYSARASHAETRGQPEIAKLYRHIQEEERKHQEEFLAEQEKLREKNGGR